MLSRIEFAIDDLGYAFCGDCARERDLNIQSTEPRESPSVTQLSSFGIDLTRWSYGRREYESCDSCSKVVFEWPETECEQKEND